MAELKALWQRAEEALGKAELRRLFRAWVNGVIRKARIRESNKDASALEREDCERIIADLNRRSGCRYQVTDGALHLVRKLLKQGYGVDDFMRVHEVKSLQWKGNVKMEHCLRPSTLYRAKHFDEYLGEWWKLENGRRSKAKTAPTQKAEMAKVERDALVDELMGRGWAEHESWHDFMMWTLRFPDRAALEGYEMPARLRQMREAMSVVRLLEGRVDWAEKEYQEIKERMRVQS